MAFLDSLWFLFLFSFQNHWLLFQHNSSKGPEQGLALCFVSDGSSELTYCCCYFGNCMPRVYSAPTQSAWLPRQKPSFSSIKQGSKVLPGDTASMKEDRVGGGGGHCFQRHIWLQGLNSPGGREGFLTVEAFWKSCMVCCWPRAGREEELQCTSVSCINEEKPFIPPFTATILILLAFWYYYYFYVFQDGIFLVKDPLYAHQGHAKKNNVLNSVAQINSVHCRIPA